MIIVMNDEDIALGEPWCDPWCAVARAIRRHIPTAKNVYAYAGEIGVDGKIMKPTRQLIKFMQDFDHGEPVKPIEFWLALVEKEVKEPSLLVKRLWRIYGVD